MDERSTESPEVMEPRETAERHLLHWAGDEPAKSAATPRTFHETFVDVFDAQFERLFRVFDRLSGDPELAADLVQEAFIKMYRRGSLPDVPASWLLTVAMNLFRNARTRRSRRLALLTRERAAAVHSDPLPGPDVLVESEESRGRVRAVMDRLSERDRRLLLLSVEGFSYRDIAAAAGVRESSVGVFIARARQAFRKAYEDAADGS